MTGVVSRGVCAKSEVCGAGLLNTKYSGRDF